jgi:hypothetical protein
MTDSLGYASSPPKYRATWLGGVIEIEIRETAIFAKGRSSGKRFETTIPYTTLQPHIDRVWVRTAVFR